ncbi:ABC transporter permease [Pedobacter metabolipauper]|uniref:Putative ABC transport system permease protein n=1 Tax=Pedobacter metabolipauper TaxID=425513 RepID=A0A4R6SUU6_9SPHI|nr:ABC transporter permease [Pedobacter metabolipauper]TDQ08796.1 putative ABC transport system permease protein [Pedobacter metabolipauper]
MFKLNLKIALRNLWTNKLFTAINIFGLSVGLTGFMLILVYVNYERSYDSWNPEAEQVYRLSITDNPGEEEYPSSPGELAPALKAIAPEITAYSRFYFFDLEQRLMGEPGNEHFIDHIMGVDSNWMELFPYKFIYGSVKAPLASANDIVLSNKISKQFFGDSNPVGKTLKINQKKSYTVTGVFEAPASPEHMEHNGFVQMSSKGDGWGNGNFVTYLKLAKGTDPKQFEVKLNQLVKTLPIAKRESKKRITLHIQSVKDIYLHATAVQDIAKRGNAANITILLALSSLLLIIACINFANLSIAQSAKRAKETGIRKVMGAFRTELIVQFLTETTVQCLLALFLSVVLAEMCIPVLNMMMGTELQLFNPASLQKLSIQISLVILIVILVSGGYAAFFLSGFKPARVLKGDFSRGTGSLWLRKSLIVAQFIIASVFISALLVINNQLDFMKHKDKGFNSDQVLIFKVRKGDTRRNFDQIKQRLLQIEGVKKVSRVNYYPGIMGMQVIGSTVAGKQIDNLSIVTVDPDYFEVMGMKAVKGALFSGRHSTDSASIIVNEAAYKKYGMQNSLGKKWVYDFNFTGVVKNHIQKGMDVEVEPTAFIVENGNSNPADHVVVKMGSKNIQQTVKEIQSVWQTAEPFPFEYNWLDQSFQQVYIQYIRLGKLFTIFTYVTLFIAALGLFALAAFTTRQRTKEIGIRKVLGADDLDIIKLINKSFIWLILAANAVAIPLAFILTSKWLNGFVYRAQISILPFCFALLISMIITILTVSFQAYKAAKATPVHALKYE